MIRVLQWLGVLHLIGLAGTVALLSSSGDQSTNAHAAIRADGPPCDTCGQPVTW